MAHRQEIIAHLDNLLSPHLFRDYCPNGLQVQGKDSIQTVVTGVTANVPLIEAAQDLKADAILVHHGIIWNGRTQALTDVFYERVKGLIKSDINLMAYHLPLDAHPVWGNNVQLAKHLNLEVESFVDIEKQPGLSAVARLPEPLSSEEFAQRISHSMQREPLMVKGRSPKIERVAICTGAAQNYLPNMIALGVDAYLTGEHSLAMVELAQESGIHFIAAGHHATERYGIQVLGLLIKEHFKLDVHFVDIPNPA